MTSTNSKSEVVLARVSLSESWWSDPPVGRILVCLRGIHCGEWWRWVKENISDVRYIDFGKDPATMERKYLIVGDASYEIDTLYRLKWGVQDV